MFVGIKDLLFAASKVGMYLSREQGIFGYVSISRILIQWKQKQPNDANKNE